MKVCRGDEKQPWVENEWLKIDARIDTYTRKLHFFWARCVKSNIRKIGDGLVIVKHGFSLC